MGTERSIRSAGAGGVAVISEIGFHTRAQGRSFAEYGVLAASLIVAIIIVVGL